MTQTTPAAAATAALDEGRLPPALEPPQATRARTRRRGTAPVTAHAPSVSDPAENAPAVPAAPAAAPVAPVPDSQGQPAGMLPGTSPMDVLGRLVAPEALAEALGVTADTVLGWAPTAGWDCYRLPDGSVRIDPASVLAVASAPGLLAVAS